MTIAKAKAKASDQSVTTQENLITRLLTVDGPTLRSFFDHADNQIQEERNRVVSDYKAEVATIKSNIGALNKERDELIERISKIEGRIQQELQAEENEDLVHANTMSEIEKKRSTVEALHTMFRARITGFEA